MMVGATSLGGCLLEPPRLRELLQKLCPAAAQRCEQGCVNALSISSQDLNAQPDSIFWMVAPRKVAALATHTGAGLRTAVEAPAPAVPEEVYLHVLISFRRALVNHLSVHLLSLLERKDASYLRVQTAAHSQHRHWWSFPLSVRTKEDTDVCIHFGNPAAPSAHCPGLCHQIWLLCFILHLCIDYATPTAACKTKAVANDPAGAVQPSVHKHVLLLVEVRRERTIICVHLAEDPIQSLVVTAPPTHNNRQADKDALHVRVGLELAVIAVLTQPDRKPGTWHLRWKRLRAIRAIGISPCFRTSKPGCNAPPWWLCIPNQEGLRAAIPVHRGARPVLTAQSVLAIDLRPCTSVATNLEGLAGLLLLFIKTCRAGAGRS
mmetsp:Transcript_84779/g.162215  ORF Transcript_84779/g.162215 Transcript_84779/m.162215 type:complete len:376 (-) Transcript_84779:230-1357(-)